MSTMLEDLEDLWEGTETVGIYTTTVNLQTRQDGGSTEWEGFYSNPRQRMQCWVTKNSTGNIITLEEQDDPLGLGRKKASYSSTLSMTDFRVTTFEEFKDKFVIVLRDTRTEDLPRRLETTAIAKLLGKKRYEISIQIHISETWKAGARELVRKCFQVTEPFKASGEYEGQRLERALRLLFSKLRSPHPCKQNEFQNAEREVEAAKKLLKENMCTELGSVYWNSWERNQLRAQEFRMWKYQYDVILGEWIPQAKKQYEDHAHSLGMKPDKERYVLSSAQLGYQKTLQTREGSTGNNEGTSAQNSRKRARTDTDDDSLGLQIDGNGPSVVEDAELWKLC